METEVASSLLELRRSRVEKLQLLFFFLFVLLIISAAFRFLFFLRAREAASRAFRSGQKKSHFLFISGGEKSLLSVCCLCFSFHVQKGSEGGVVGRSLRLPLFSSNISQTFSATVSL